MITKQQALEFIYDLSQKTEVMLDVSCGEMQFNHIIDGDYLYTSFAGESTLEAAVERCIEEHIEAIVNYVDRIPIDVSRLEVGQTCEIHCDELQITDEITTINDMVYFKRNYPIGIKDIKEVYMVRPNDK